MPEYRTSSTAAEDLAETIKADMAELLFAMRDGLASTLRDELAAVGVSGDAALAFSLDRGREALVELLDDLRDLDAPPSVLSRVWVADEALRQARTALLSADPD